jgi:hypothetical protein
VSGEVLSLLIEAGKLQNKIGHSEAEIEEALTAFLFDIAGERKFSRVRRIMADRWHGCSNKEPRA